MILVKSLIALLLILIGFYAYEKLHLLAYFDGREGFKNDKHDEYTSESILKASKAKADETIEMKFSEKIPLDQHKELANDAVEMSKLQEKMNELLKLKHEATDINNKLKIKK
jgi:hypothetical protein